MERQIITVDIAPGNNQIQRLKSSQGDIGRPLGVYIIQNGVALDCSAYTADLYILKPDGNFFTGTATVDATEHNLITWETAEQETPVAGDCAAQIRILSNGDDIGTARFVEYVEASPGFCGESSESVIDSLKEYVRQAAASAETASDAASSATGSASAASGSASAAASSASAAAGSASTAHTDAETASQAAQTAQDVADSIPEDYSALSDDVTSLKSAIKTVAQGIYIETDSVPIVSISDGADDQPMKAVKVAIEPVQDLHGYDYPWPAGGGVNQFDESTVTFGKWINAAGVKGSAEFGCISEAIPINGNSGCVFKYYGTQPNSCSVVEYASDDTFITRNHASNGDVSCTFNANTAYIVVQVSAPSSPSIAITPTILASYKMLLCFGSTAPTYYTPYSNVCPISGWTGAKVTRCGKNLWKNEYPNISTGSRVTYYPVYVGNNPVTVSTDAPGNSADVANLFALPGNVDTGANSATNGLKNNITITVTPIDGYITIGARSYNGLDPREYHTQIEIGSTATAYEPYQGQTYEVTFPADPGTVYGGTLDVASRKLVVDRAMSDLGNLAWTIDTLRFKTVQLASIIKRVSANTEILAGLICEMYRAASNNNTGASSVYDDVMAVSAAGNLFVKDTSYATVADFVSAVTGIKVVYPLATPQEITLTPTEIKTLLGINNVWADAGNTSITYPADTKTYIDNRINSTRKLIAGIETSFVASKPYAVGDMLIIGDDLYKVASSIASGATITVGTNVNKTTVAEQLLALANA